MLKFTIIAHTDSDNHIDLDWARVDTSLFKTVTTPPHGKFNCFIKTRRAGALIKHLESNDPERLELIVYKDGIPNLWNYSHFRAIGGLQEALEYAYDDAEGLHKVYVVGGSSLFREAMINYDWPQIEEIKLITSNFPRVSERTVDWDICSAPKVHLHI